ncbi:hexitol phosphatase HxpB [Chondrinema litorale]|uniref:hexitol phosphatase HxpB n=1 Tax=Chondrinema litorale TaxID=2994555 RepID=UPI0025433B5D|nr:hexitol phosphatase HxpB [Chondrinema litorale]UZR99467.1 hexitol phosphatase HxpB [Chondrinema litorale]
MIRAVIFDMDGIIIDSEPLWKKAEKLVFTSMGVNVTEEQAAVTASLTTREVTEYWFNNSPWQNTPLHEVENAVIDKVGELIATQGKPIDGIANTLEFFKQRKFKIGLATNSPYQLIPLVLEKVGITHYFDAITSSDEAPKGKPDPAVYLTTAHKLDIPPQFCLAFEDSGSGLRAAKRAGMKAVAIPASFEYDHPKFDIADLKLTGFKHFTEQHLRYLSESQT